MALRSGVNSGAGLPAWESKRTKIIALFLLFCCTMTTLQAITLQWDANRETDLAGYKVYYGETNSSYVVVNAGKTNSITLNSLAPGKTYNFYVTAYNTAGLESNPSQAISYTVPQPANTTIRWDPSSSTNLAYYTLAYRELYGATNLTTFKTTERSLLIPNLTAGKAYFFWVNAFDANGVRCDLYRPIGPMLPPGDSTFWPPRVSAIYMSWDGTTKGDWIGQYGQQDSWVASAPEQTSPYFGPITNGTYQVFAQNSPNKAAPLVPDGSTRTAACWLAQTSMTVPIAFGDSGIHRVTVYCADLENLGLQEYIDVVEPNGVCYTSVLIGGFQQGVYLIFDVKGSFSIRFRSKVGNYVTASGFFLD
jgi:hypothetical protein